MRLLTLDGPGTISLTGHHSYNNSAYGILSHTWGPASDEISYHDVLNGRYKEKPAWFKVLICIERARRDGLQYIWVDSCCIDRSSSSELSEAINSMFEYFRNAARCYVYLSDVSVTYQGDRANPSVMSAFKKSRWFTRSWTLQELLAPASVAFYSREGLFIGTKLTLMKEIHEITGIPLTALQGAPLSDFTIEERLRWAANRHATREEDEAYSLMGIFDIFMPLMYGEGLNGSKRLKDEIYRKEIPKQEVPKAVIESAEARPDVEALLSDVQEAVNSVEPQGAPYGLIPKTLPFETILQGFHGTKSGSITQDKHTDNEKFRYSPIAESSFRLFVLEPGALGSSILGQILEYPLDHCPPYYALSYVWGHEPKVHQISIDGKTEFVQPNLFHALQRLRLPGGQLHIWIDALCINQSDHAEKTVQVRQMATIYHSASGVLAWLGEEDAASKFALDFVPELISSEFQWIGSWWDQYEFAALAQFLERPWFQRAWILQETAFSKVSTIQCGDRKVFMDHFIMAIDSVRAGLSTIESSFTLTPNMMRNSTLMNFWDSPAVKLLDIIEGVFSKSTQGDILQRNMSLEDLVDASTFSETSDQRDAIYALLNLANNITFLSPHDRSDIIVPDYKKSVLDVFADFVLHCCRQSESLDIICRPWAPVLASPAFPINRDAGFTQASPVLPSWIATRDKLSFGNPSSRSDRRLHANPLACRTQKRPYNAHCGLKPHVSIGRNDDGTCNGSLLARGIFVGDIVKTSARLADAIVTKECLAILGMISRNPHSSLIDLPDVIWRTLCADRDGKGELAPRFYRVAMLQLLQLNSTTPKPDDSTDLLDHMSSIDIDDLLETQILDHIKAFLMVVRSTIWNRRTFRATSNEGNDRPLVGLAPQQTKNGDQLCILYGCSVPVVLRQLPKSSDRSRWQLIGAAYVHGLMDGEAFRFLSSDMLKMVELDFAIW